MPGLLRIIGKTPHRALTPAQLFCLSFTVATTQADRLVINNIGFSELLRLITRLPECVTHVTLQSIYVDKEQSPSLMKQTIEEILNKRPVSTVLRASSVPGFSVFMNSYGPEQGSATTSVSQAGFFSNPQAGTSPSFVYQYLYILSQQLLPRSKPEVAVLDKTHIREILTESKKLQYCIGPIVANIPQDICEVVIKNIDHQSLLRGLKRLPNHVSHIFIESIQIEASDVITGNQLKAAIDYILSRRPVNTTLRTMDVPGFSEFLHRYTHDLDDKPLSLPNHPDEKFRIELGPRGLKCQSCETDFKSFSSFLASEAVVTLPAEKRHLKIRHFDLKDVVKMLMLMPAAITHVSLVSIRLSEQETVADLKSAVAAELNTRSTSTVLKISGMRGYEAIEETHGPTAPGAAAAATAAPGAANT